MEGLEEEQNERKSCINFMPFKPHFVYHNNRQGVKSKSTHLQFSHLNQCDLSAEEAKKLMEKMLFERASPHATNRSKTANKAGKHILGGDGKFKRNPHT